MLTNEQKLAIAKRITESATFKHAPTSSAILLYLVEAHIDHRHLKEGIIDLEFFNANPNEDKNNPRVRVNIYNLRKKLVRYYEEEGAKEEWQVKIDKGQYDLRFENIQPASVPFSIAAYSHLLPYALLSVVFALFLIFQIPRSQPKVWADFFQNGHPSYLFIGDAFGYRGKTVSGQQGWTRDFQVNSLEEYYSLVDTQPVLKETTYPSDFFYSTRMAEHATHDLARFFTQWEQDFEIKYATKASFSDIKKGNTLYIGRWLNQSDFVYLLNEGNPYVEIQSLQIIVQGHPSVPDTVIQTPPKGEETDYAVVARIPGPGQTAQFLFLSNHDIGVMATVSSFTQADSLTAFTQKYLGKHNHFVAIYQAHGKERINLKLKNLMVLPF